MPPHTELSVQLYSLRKFGDLPNQLQIVTDSGFRNVELLESHLKNGATADHLARHDLKARSAHVCFETLAERPGTMMSAANSLGIDLLIVPAPPEKYRSGHADWRGFVDDLVTVTQDIQNEGGRLAYHNHHWELAEIDDGKTVLDYILDVGGQAGLEWQGDLAWIVRGGGNPVDCVERWGDRLTSIHVKDIAPSGSANEEEGWADVGHGVVDWRPLWKAAKLAGAALMIAEHDAPMDGNRFCSRSFERMRQLKIEFDRI